MVFIFDSENEGLSLKIQCWPRSDCLAYSPGRGCVDLDLQLIPRLPGNQNGVYLSLCTSQNTVFLSRRASNMSWSRPHGFHDLPMECLGPWPPFWRPITACILWIGPMEKPCNKNILLFTVEHGCKKIRYHKH